MKEGWKYKTLGDVGTFVRGGNFSKKDFVENGYPCIHYGQIHMKFGTETFKHISSVPAEMVKPDRCAHKGDLVIAITSEDDAGSCKCTAWMGDYDVYVGGHTAIFRHTLQPKYVSYYFMSPYFQKDKLEFTHGFKVVEISPKDIAKITIPVPPSSEQQRIVEYLDAAFAKIDALKTNAQKQLNEAKVLFQTSLKEMLEPKEGWEEKKLEEICDFRSGFAFKSNKFTKIGEPIIRISDIQNEEVDDSNLVYFDPKSYTEDLSRYLIYPNDILIAMSGGTTGKIGINTSGRTFYLNQRVGVFRENKKHLNHKYLFYFLHTKSEESLRIAAGAAQPNLSTAQIKSFIVPVPPLSEQQSIVETLDSLKSKVDRLQENFDKISQECDALKQAILKETFE